MQNIYIVYSKTTPISYALSCARALEEIGLPTTTELSVQEFSTDGRRECATSDGSLMVVEVPTEEIYDGESHIYVATNFDLEVMATSADLPSLVTQMGDLHEECSMIVSIPGLS